MAEMSETTRQGVEVLNSFDATMTAEDEELLLQQRILQSKALDDRRARQRAEEDLKFARHKIADRDKKLEEARTKLAAQTSLVGVLQKQLDQKESANAALKSQVHELTMQMERFKSSSLAEITELKESLTASRMLSGSTASGAGGGVLSPSEGGANMTRQGSLTKYIAQKAKNLGMKRKFKALREYHEQASQAMECALMEEADMHSMVTERCLARGVAPINDLLKAEAGIETDSDAGSSQKEPKLQRRSTLVSYDGLKRHGRGHGNALNFNEQLDTKMPDDVFVNAKIEASGFKSEYTEFRKSIRDFAKSFKKDSDNALNGLWFIFTEKDKGPSQCVLANPKEDFQKEIRTALTKTRTNLLDLIRNFNNQIKNVLGNERRVKQAWLTEQRPVRHMEVQVDIPPPEDPRIAEYQDEIGFLKSRQAQIHEEHTTKNQDLEMQREKAEVNMQFLQQKVFSLHSAVHTALHSVYKHRFHWGPRCPNHFAPLTQDKDVSKKRQLEVGYNVLLGQAIDLEIKSLGQFADYFVSDQLFGVDLAAAFNPVSTKEQERQQREGGNDAPTAGAALVMKRKEAVPLKKAKVDQARKLSNQLDMMLKEEKAAVAAVTTTTATGSPSTTALDAEKENTNTAKTIQQKRNASGSPPPTTLKKTSSFNSIAANAPAPSSNSTTSARRNSSGASQVPSCATRTTSSTRKGASPPNAHVDANSKAATAASSANTARPTASPVQVSVLPTSTINVDIGIDIGAAPPKGPPVQRFQSNRRTVVGGFVAFAPAS